MYSCVNPSKQFNKIYLKASVKSRNGHLKNPNKRFTASSGPSYRANFCTKVVANMLDFTKPLYVTSFLNLTCKVCVV